MSTEIINYLLLEWYEKCEQFLNDHQSQHEWSMYNVLYAMATSKHLNVALIENCIEILPKCTSERATYIVSRICRNPTLTMDMVLAYPDIQWDFKRMSKFMNINVILNHLDMSDEWFWDEISCNVSVTMEIVLCNIHEKWNWCKLSRNAGISMVDIEAHMDLPWNWYDISYNPNMTVEIIETRCPEKGWNWHVMQISHWISITCLRITIQSHWN